MKLILIVFFWKKNCVELIDNFGPKNGTSSKLWIYRKIFLKILCNEKGQQVDDSNNNSLYCKIFVQDKWAILGQKVAYAGSTLRQFLRILQSERG